jgi:hypothetical protein
MLTMETVYAAYGLRLVSSFALPGMTETRRGIEDLPSLALALVEPENLDHAWSGSSDAPEWSGRQGDGRDLVIQRGAAGDVLFLYGDLARFRLRPDMHRLDCAPSDSSLDWQRVLLGKVLPAISLMCGYEALHAAAVDSPEGVVAIMAPSGMGKSTLALELIRRGWPLFADDVLTLSAAANRVQAHPGTPHMNVAPFLPDGGDPRAVGSPIGLLGGELWLAASASSSRPRPVRLLCLLERHANFALGACALRPNPVLLAPYMLGLSSDPERVRDRFELYADLLESTTLVRLTAGPEYAPDQLADLVEDVLSRQPEFVGEGVQ